MSGFIDTVAKASEVAKMDSNQPSNRFDADKRIDAEKNKLDDGKEKRFDPDKRIDVKAQLEKAIEQYKQDLIDNSPFPDTLNLDDLKPENIAREPKEKVQEKRNDFKSKKNDLIKEWENQTGKEWPRYKEDVKRDGVVVARAGDLFDAHHIKPLCWGGENTASNITPMEWGPHHLNVHGADSGYNTALKLV